MTLVLAGVHPLTRLQFALGALGAVLLVHVLDVQLPEFDLHIEHVGLRGVEARPQWLVSTRS